MEVEIFKGQIDGDGDGDQISISASGPQAAMSDNNNKVDKILLQLSEKLGPNWESLATYLGIPNDRIVAIKRDQNETEQQIFQMLMAWRNDFSQPQGQMPTVLSVALKLHGRTDLANHVLQDQGTFWQTPKPSGLPRPVYEDLLPQDLLRNLSMTLAGGWEQLACHLGVPYEQVGKFKRDFYGVDEQIFQMLMRWKNGSIFKQQPRDILVNGLEAIGRMDLAQKLIQDTKKK